MKKRMRTLSLVALAVFSLACLSGFFFTTDDTEDREAELKRVRKLADEILTEVSARSGLVIKHSVDIKVINKAEIKVFLEKLIDEEYPDGELQLRSDALAMFGLMPEGYDIKAGLIALMLEQAAAFFDPRTKAYYTIIDLDPMLKVPMMEKTIVAHELTHALQDQAVDLLKLNQDAKDDNDLTYARNSLIEGMASVVMVSIMQNVPPEKLKIDLGKMMRMSMSMMSSNPMMKELMSVPEYLRESLVSPYAEGASFVQAFLRKNPDSKPAVLMDNMPVSAEQILHLDKYLEKDIPTEIDLTAVSALLPAEWQHLFSDNLGEFDVKVLCELFEETKPSAGDIAAGWDGLNFATFINGKNKLLLAASVWDSEADAGEFAAGIAKILTEKHGSEKNVVEQKGNMVVFVAGDLVGLPTNALMGALAGSAVD